MRRERCVGFNGRCIQFMVSLTAVVVLLMLFLRRCEIVQSAHTNTHTHTQCLCVCVCYRETAGSGHSNDRYIWTRACKHTQAVLLFLYEIVDVFHMVLYIVKAGAHIIYALRNRTLYDG